MKTVTCTIERDAKTPKAAALEFVDVIASGAAFPLHLKVRDEDGRDHHVTIDADEFASARKESLA